MPSDANLLLTYVSFHCPGTVRRSTAGPAPGCVYPISSAMAASSRSAQAPRPRSTCDDSADMINNCLTRVVFLRL